MRNLVMIPAMGCDGGLYAELIRSRSFDGPRPLEGWRLIAEGDGAGSMELDDVRPVSEVSPRSLRLRAERCGQGRVGERPREGSATGPGVDLVGVVRMVGTVSYTHLTLPTIYSV